MNLFDKNNFRIYVLNTMMKWDRVEYIENEIVKIYTKRHSSECHFLMNFNKETWNFCVNDDKKPSYKIEILNGEEVIGAFQFKPHTTMWEVPHLGPGEPE